jgi:L-ascorbate metabolism protein UlaG (beta-lactamase superfamily)
VKCLSTSHDPESERMTAKKKNHLYQGPVTDHFDGHRFFVPGHMPGHNTDKSRGDMVKWTKETKAKWPKAYPSPHKPEIVQRVDGIRSTFIGHASYLLQVAGRNFLIDPVFATRASPFQFAGPKRVNQPGIALNHLPPIDAVLVTHNHYDHLDKASLWVLEQKHAPQFVAPLGVDANIAKGKRAPKRMHTLDWGQSYKFDDFTIHAVPTYHWSARWLNDRRMTLWCSFVIETPRGTIYHIGDTGYGAGEFSKRVRRDFGPIALAHIPIGAYEPRWFMKDHHVNPEEAVQIFQDCGAQNAIGHHWGTFQLTNEAIDQPEKDLAVALAAAEISAEKFIAFRPGQVLEI